MAPLSPIGHLYLMDVYEIYVVAVHDLIIIFCFKMFVDEIVTSLSVINMIN